MSYSYTFANVTSFTTPQLDTVLNQAGLLGTIPCSVTGTNALTLTPLTAPTAGTPPLAYQPQLRISGVALNSNTTAVSANVVGLGALNVYKDGSAGPVALTGGEIVAGNYFALAYDATLNANTGGWHLINSLTIGAAPSGAAGGDLGGSYPNPSVLKINGVPLGATTSTAGNILVGQGANWLTKTLSGDATLAATGAITVTKTNGTALTGASTMAFVAPAAWTPTDNSGAALTFSGVSATYTRHGNIIFAGFSITYPSTADTSPASIAGLPVAVPNQTYAQGPAAVWCSGGSIAIILRPTINTSTAAFLNQATAAAVTNADLSGLTVRGMLIYPAS